MSKIMQSKHFKYIVLVLLFLGWCLGNLDRFVINYAIVGITQDLGLSASAQGVILSSFFLGYAIMQIPGGALADRFGYRKVILVSLFSWSVFTILTGSAWSLFSLIFVRFLFGIGEGSFFPSGSKAIATNFPVNQRSGAMSIMLASGAIMGVVTPIVTGHALVSIGWRNLFYIIGAVGIFITALMFFLLKEPAVKSKLADGTSGQQPKMSLKAVLKTPMIWNLFISYFSIYAVNWGLQSWMPTYMVNVRGLDMTQMGVLAAIPALVSIFTMLLSGYVLDRIPAGKDRIIASVFGVLVAVFLYLMSHSGTITTFITYMTIVTVMAGFISTLIISKSLKTMPESVVATANGFINTGAQLAGFLTPMLIGFLVQASGGSYATAFIMLICFALICSITLMFSRRVNSDQDTTPEVQATAV
ncbi:MULTISPECIES: MFS transporter [Paenibacillus]|uniref:Sugar phosphate permease n=1 Tax=Paenibacillus pabuli TaxID=1472 RepID=A0A855YH00_9BACL|nr:MULTISPECIES: MFS transporter [Paenibacillus]PWW43471.1 sugar phosphate permease [Paenibacillus pabuli]PXW09378.1 sugar phosphate permease [Paenibacillus taichungensis]RAJ02971.1 sugar phosphate permease [Paenibacillus pabuli]